MQELLPGIPDPLFGQEGPHSIGQCLQALQWLDRSATPYPGDDETDGMIICGGGKFWPGVVVAIRMLREYSSLPVEVWHRAEEEIFPEDLADVPDVTIINADNIPHRLLKRWEIKLLAMTHCRFRRIFYVDADAYPVADPQQFLDLLTGQRGIVFWSDFPNHATSIKWADVWPEALVATATQAPLAKTLPCVQGGQLAIDRRKFWHELVLAHWICQHSDYYFEKIYGDQDAWRVVLAITRGQFLHLGPAEWREYAFVCTLSGQPMIVHRCMSKLLPIADLTEGDTKLTAMHVFLPEEERVFHHLAYALRRHNDSAAIFASIYDKGLWNGVPGSSGDGSKAGETDPYLTAVNGVLRLTEARSVVDLGTGDGDIIRKISAPDLQSVVGVDCYAAHITRLTGEIADRRFLCLDIFEQREQLPEADVALIKDVLQHWTNRMIQTWLDWLVQSGKYRWIVLTNDANQLSPCQDTHLGGCRGLQPNWPPLKRFRPQTILTYQHKAVVLLVGNRVK